VEPGRAVHIGDEESDRQGAEAAGMGFEPVPLASLPARLGLEK
jgi:FMN phosphatase YigB (HAD superfamily)